MANILILDIGNSNSKCYIFDVNQCGRRFDASIIHEEHQETNRGHPWDLVDTVQNMMIRAIEVHKPDYGMVTAFGDAFVYYDPANNGRPRFVFADEEAKPQGLDYTFAGFPTGKIDITGVRSLRLKHGCEDEHIVPVNIAIARELGGNSNWNKWDITQASASGDYSLRDDFSMTCQPHDEVGMFKGVPVLAGGLDNAFLDTTNESPYIVAGTWLVVSTIKKEFEPTETRRKHGIRWLISGNGRYLAQTVRRSQRPLTQKLGRDILSDFQAMGYGGDTYQKIRVLGSYSKDLCRLLDQIAGEQHFDFEFKDYGEQYRESAIYVYKKKRAIG